MRLEHKLNPLQFRTLEETRTHEGIWWGDVGVKEPAPTLRRGPGGCWADVRLRGSSDLGPSFESCANAPRSGFLTCLVHHDRELAARELRCEMNGVTMESIAYTDWQDEEAHRAQRQAARVAARAAKTKPS
jgi:hypothetical protein